MTGEHERPTEFDGRIAAGKDWREIVAWVGDLPPMPHVASRAISMVEDPETTATGLSEILSSDTALAARVLKIANSAMFSRQREITTLNQAIMVIGFKALKGIIVAATLRQLNKGTSKVEKLIWENSMATASAAHIITKRLKKRYIEESFLLGLLRSLGQIVLLSQAAPEYKKVVENVSTRNLSFVDAETEIFGFAHPLIGALVAKKWNFSADTCQVILHYKDYIEGGKPESELDEKTVIVQLSDIVSRASGIGTPEGYPDEREDFKILGPYLGFDPKTLDATFEELVTQTKEQFDADRHVYE